jgi:hypothetical protein
MDLLTRGHVVGVGAHRDMDDIALRGARAILREPVDPTGL